MLRTSLPVILFALIVNAQRLVRLPAAALTSAAGHTPAASALLSPLTIMTSLSISASTIRPSSSSSVSVSSISPASSSVRSETASSFSVSSSKPDSLTATPTPTGLLRKRAAIPGCLKTVELSCLNLVANCINGVTADTRDNLWSIDSCVVAATCYGVGNLITSVNCQTGFSMTNSDQASLDYTNVYASIVGSCAFASGGCPVTQQNYIDFYYGTLTAINTANFPSSSSVVVAFWTALTAWTATGNSVPYLNLNDWYHFSSFPSTPTTTPPPVTTFSVIYWNPNPSPSTNAISETFVKSGQTTIIAIPTSTTTVTIAGATLTLDPGGQPIGGPVPTDVSLPGAVTPTWDNNPIPPSGASSVTFTGPPSYTTVVPVPTSSDSPPVNVTGPPGDKNDDGDDWWLLLFGALIRGSLPADIGIIGGSIPQAIPPPTWTGPWTDPEPSSSDSETSTTTSTSSCPLPTAAYDLPDDPENADWEDEGTDPDTRRKRSTLIPRADKRHVSVPRCQLSADSSRAVTLGAGIYWSVGPKAAGGTGTTLSQSNVPGRPGVGGETPQEHVFELGYINQFFTPLAQLSCAWLTTNIFNYVRADGSNMGTALSDAIDQTANLVWVDKALNQAKSNVVNQNRAGANNPPQQASMNAIADFTTSATAIQDVEFFLRNWGALGQYFSVNSNRFQATAARVQALLAEVTPDVAINPSLPTVFNSWLRNLMGTYSAGITSRAVNTYNYYVNRMNTVSTLTQTPVPVCYAVYQDSLIAPSPFKTRLQNGGFNFAPLMPAAPTLPGCDGPGTKGRFSLYLDTNSGQPVFIHGLTFTIMGSGNSDFWAIGSGANIGDTHFLAEDLAPTYGGVCNDVYQFAQRAPTAGVPDVNIAVNCGGLTGNVNAPFQMVVGGQQLSCLLFNWNDGSNLFNIICGPSQATTNNCLLQVKAMNPTLPNSYISVPSFSFVPN